MFVETVLKSTFGFSYVLFVTALALYHVYNVFRVAVNVMIILMNLVSPVELNVWFSGFPPSTKTNTSNSNSISNARTLSNELLELFRVTCVNK